MTITIKPHHLLDVYKLYGRGIYPFSPDEKFGHDFYLVGNYLINHQVKSVIFTAHSDDICRPCRYLKNGVCNDELDLAEFRTKNDYNLMIDQKLLFDFQWKENTSYQLDHLLSSIVEQATPELFCKVWSYSAVDDSILRFTQTLNGVKRYLQCGN